MLLRQTISWCVGAPNTLWCILERRLGLRLRRLWMIAVRRFRSSQGRPWTSSKARVAGKSCQRPLQISSGGSARTNQDPLSNGFERGSFFSKNYNLFPTNSAKSASLQEYPHSLSYQPKTFIILSFTIVCSKSIIEE